MSRVARRVWGTFGVDGGQTQRAPPALGLRQGPSRSLGTSEGRVLLRVRHHRMGRGETRGGGGTTPRPASTQPTGSEKPAYGRATPVCARRGPGGAAEGPSGHQRRKPPVLGPWRVTGMLGSAPPSLLSCASF